MTALIVRLRSPWLRVPLWSLWFPFALLDVAVDAVRCDGFGRLLRTEFWRMAVDVFVVGIDGLDIG